MSINFKSPTISKKTKAGQIIKNNEVIQSVEQSSININSLKKKLKIKKTKNFHNHIENNYIGDGKQKYIISGKNKIDMGNKTATRAYQMKFEAKPNLTKDQLKAVVYSKLLQHYQRPSKGSSTNNIISISINSFKVPKNYNFSKNAHLHRRKPLSLYLFDKLTNEKIKVKNNCVYDYLFNELRKIYNKKVKADKLLNQLNEFCINIIDNGCTLEQLEKFIKKYYKNVSVDAIGPDFKMMMTYRPGCKVRSTHILNLTFYVNNAHIYPITNTHIQEYIKKRFSDSFNNISSYFEDLHNFEFNQDFEYMTSHDMKQEEGKTYILNKNFDIDDYLCDLVNSFKYGIEYIDMDTSTGQIKKFKHPTKNIFYVAYNDYHQRLKTHTKLNELLSGTYGEFNNMSYASMATNLLKHFDILPKSYYNKKTYYYLNKYETKPLYDCVKNCNKDNAHGIDAYKQYSTIFYKMFADPDFFIPIYDIHNKVKKYNGEDITTGEYFIKPIKYKKVKCFGYFVHYHIVKKLLQLEVITKKDITLCINTKRQFKPDCFKEYVKLTSKLDEENFKTMNNILNGTLKNHKIKKGSSYFTDDITSLCYIISEAENNNDKYSWNYHEKTGFNFLKIFTEKPNYENTSSFYRSCLSCSLIQTICMIKKASKYGDIVKVQTDAVYYEPKNKKNIFKQSERSDGILNNLGKKFNEYHKTDFYKCRYTPKKFIEYTEPEKTNHLYIGCGGSGKTYKIISDSNTEDNILFLSTSNNAVLELQLKAKHIKKSYENWSFATFAYAFARYPSYRQKLNYLNKFEKIIIDEIFMTSPTYMRVLKNCDSLIYYVGDQWQLSPIFTKYEEPYDMFKNMFDDCIITKKEYNPLYKRYTLESYNIFEKFKNTGKSQYLKPLPQLDHNKVYPFYLCSTNAVRIEYNKKCCDYFYPNGKEEIFKNTKTLYDDIDNTETETKEKEEKYKIGIDMPIICIKNLPQLREKSIFNNWKGYISSMSDKTITISGVMVDVDGEWAEDESLEIDKMLFLSNFLPLHASTVHKFQGSKIKGEYAILQLNAYKNRLCNLNMLYTALTRCEDYKNVHIDHHRRALDDIFKPIQYNELLIGMNRPRKDYYYYKINYNCNCPQKKYIIASEKKQKTITPYYKTKYKIKHNNCKYEMSLLVKKNIHYSQVQFIIKNLNYHYTKIRKLKNPLLIQTYKYIKQHKNKNTLYISQNNIRYVYYDDDMNKHIKKMNTIKNTPDIVLKNMKQITDKFKCDKIKCSSDKITLEQSKMILCFN